MNKYKFSFMTLLLCTGMGCSHTHEGKNGAGRAIASSSSELRVDRVGTGEVTQWFLCMRPFDKIPTQELPYMNRRMEMPCKDVSIKDQFNSEDSFNIPEGHKEEYRKHLANGLRAFDAADSYEDNGEASERARPNFKRYPLDWGAPEKHPLLERMVSADWLLVDTTKGCQLGRSRKQRSYMDIEMGLITGISKNDQLNHKTCGGRTVNDDFLDTIVTIHVNGPRRLPKGLGYIGADLQANKGGPERQDGQKKPGKVVPLKFPYVVVVK